MSARLNEPQTHTTHTVGAMAKNALAWGVVCLIALAVFVSLASVTTFGTEDDTSTDGTATETEEVAESTASSGASWSATVGDGTTITLSVGNDPNENGVYTEELPFTITVTTTEDIDTDKTVVVDSEGVLDTSDAEWSVTTVTDSGSGDEDDGTDDGTDEGGTEDDGDDSGTSGESSDSGDTSEDSDGSDSGTDGDSNDSTETGESDGTGTDSGTDGSTDDGTTDGTDESGTGSDVGAEDESGTSGDSSTSGEATEDDATEESGSSSDEGTDSGSATEDDDTEEDATDVTEGSSSGSEDASDTTTASASASSTAMSRSLASTASASTYAAVYSAQAAVVSTVTDETEDEADGETTTTTTTTTTATLDLTLGDVVDDSIYVAVYTTEGELVGAAVFGSADDFESGVVDSSAVTATDADDNELDALTVDSSEPEVSVAMSKSATDVGGAESYSHTVTATITLTDATFDTEHSTVNGEKTTWTDNGDGTYTATVTFTYSSETGATNSYTLTVVAYDEGAYAYSSESTSSGKTYTYGSTIELTADEDPPEVSITDADGNAFSSDYYNSAQTVKITISDENISESGISVDGLSGLTWCSSTNSEMNVTTYEAVTTVSGEQAYSISVSAKDAAGNPASASASFTVDTKDPVVTVTAMDDYYGINETCKVEITVTDANLSTGDVSVVDSYDGEEVELDPLTDGDGNALTDSEGNPLYWSTADNDDGTTTYTATVTYSTEEGDPADEGVHEVTVNATDLAGNEAEEKDSGEFTVDTKDPVVTVTAMDDYYGINETCKVEITVTDANLSTGDVSVVDSYDGEEVELDPLTDGDGNALTDSEGNPLYWSTADNDDGTTTYTATVTYSTEEGDPADEGVHEVTATATDLAGNEATEKDSGEFTIDVTRPAITVSSMESYYGIDETCTATITVTDVNLSTSGISVKDGIDGEEVTLDGSGWTVTANEDGTTTYTATVTYSTAEGDAADEGVHQIIVTAQDLAGNYNSESQEAVTSGEFTVDTTRPEIEISFDNNSAENGTYYDAARVATITVKDVNMESDDIAVTGAALDGSGWTPSTDEATGVITYTATITFNADGDYSFSVEATDNAGNHNSKDGATVDSGEFTIDLTDPVLTVTWNNTDDNDGNSYYDALRTATITVVEHNFDEDLFTVTTSGTASSWSTSGDKHTMTVEFEEGNNQYLNVSGKDLAGNAATSYSSGTFHIDLTAPVIALALNHTLKATVDDVDYFSSTVKLTVTATDTNLESGTYTASGSSTASGTLTASGGTAIVTISYGENTSKNANSLQVTVTDLAGNSTTYTYGNTKASISVNGKTSKSAEYGSTSDYAGTALGGSGFYVDLTAPAIAGGSSSNIANKSYSNLYGSGSSAYVFYNSSTKLVLKVTDALGLDEVTVDAGDTVVYAVEDSVTDGATSKTITISLKDGYEFDRDVVLTAVDVAGNTTTWSISPKGTTTTSSGTSKQANTTLYAALSSLYPKALIKDTVAPVLSFSGVTAGEYYNSTQSLTLSVSELNFDYLKTYDSSQVVLTITKVAGNSSGTTTTSTVAVKSFTGTASTGEYSYTQSFAADGHYTVVAQVTDPATNVTTITQQEFTIDTTSPTISVSWDNDDVANGKYYKATRTATITIVEHNFDSSLINIETEGSVGSWSSSGDTHTITVSFTTDGTYNLSVSGADEAGNVLETYTADEFVVDLTTPTISFGSEVEDSHAYNGEVTPVIYFEDEANFDASGTSWTLVGTKNGDVTSLYQSKISTSSTDDGQTVVFVDFDQDDPEVDDIYTLTATMTDLAGNEYEASITFSVNRYGSTYRVVDASQYEENNGYVLEAPVVVVEEINVSGVEAEDNDVSVTLSADTTHLTLVESLESDELDETDFDETDTGYQRVHTTSGESDSSGWSVYTYTIGSGNFTSDGQYSVVLSSTDVSGNINTSSNYYDRSDAALANAQVTFILDETDPVVQIINVSEGEYYDADSYEVSFKVIEEVGLATDGVTVTLDGEQIEVEGDGSGSYTFTVSKAAFTSRSITITATDLAGRTGTGQVESFHVTTNILELHLPWVIAACVVVLGLIVLFIILYKRRKDEDDEDQATAA